MSGRRRYGAFSVGVLFFVASVAIVLSGEGQERIGGLAVALFGAAVALALAPLPPVPARRAISRHATGEPAFEIALSAARAVRLGVASLSFAGAGLVMAIDPGALAGARYGPVAIRVLGILAAGFFGFAAAKLLARGPARLVLTPDEVMVGTALSSESARWDEIVSVGEFDYRGSPLVGFDVPRLASDRPRWKRVFSPALGGYELSFQIRELPSWLPAELERYRSDPAARAAIGAHDELRRLIAHDE